MSDRAIIDRLTSVGRYAFGVQWADGHESILPHRNVRLACPCDECAAVEPEGRPAAGPAAAPQRVQVLGDASLFITWADGHETVLLLDEVRDLCRCAQCAGEPDYPISGR